MRINIIVPDDLLSDIDAAAKRLGISRTAYMNMAAARQLKEERFSLAFPDFDSFVHAYRQWDKRSDEEKETGKF